MLYFLLQLIILIIGGMLLTKLLFNSAHKLEIYFTGFLMNLGIFTFFWFILNTLGYSYTLKSAIFVLLIILVFYLILFFLKYKKDFLTQFIYLFKFKLINFKKLDAVFIGLIFFLFFSSLVANIYWPVRDWDSLALYDFRSIVFTNTGFMDEGVELGYFFQYPLFTSLFHTWARVNGVTNPMFIYSLIYISFVAVFYTSLRQFINKTNTLFWSLVVASLPLIYGHSTVAYTNLSYSVFFVLASIYLYRYSISYQRGELFISSILLSASIWTRYSEPFWMGSLLVAIIFAVYKRKYIDLLIYLTIIFCSRYLWIGYLSTMNLGIGSDTNYIGSSIISATRSFSMGHIADVAMFFYKNVISSWSLLFFGFMLIILVKLKKGIKSILFDGYILQVLAYMAILVLGTYIFSVTFEGWKDIPDSAVRMAMFFPPMFVYLIAVNIDKK